MTPSPSPTETSPEPAEAMEVDTQPATVVPEQASSSSRILEVSHQDAQQVVTEPEEFAPFKWREECEDDLKDMALNGVLVPEWPILQNIIKSRLVYNTHAFLVKTPRAKYRPLPTAPTTRTPLLPATSVDSFAIDDVPLETLRPRGMEPGSEEQIPSTPGGLIIPPFPPRPSSRVQRIPPGPRAGDGDPLEIANEAVIGGRTLKSEMEPGEAWAFLKGLFKLLDEFPTAPPFTIQRLCELAWKPFLQHTSIGKYLRAIEKNLLVTTTYDIYAQDEGNGDHSAQSGLSGGMNGAMQPRSRASSVSSTSSTSSQSAPLFSPIPFLIERKAIHPDGTPVGTPATLPGSSASSDADVPTSSLSLNLNITSRTNRDGDDVSMDEAEGVRPGTPMHDVSQQSMFPRDGNRSGDKEHAPLSHLALGTSGVAAFAAQTNGDGPTNGHSTQPSSGMSESAGSSADVVANEPFTGRVDELDAGPLLPQTTPTSATDPHQLHLPAADPSSSAHQEGTGERGTMTPHAMSDRPQAISSTTDLKAIPPISLSHSGPQHREADTPPASPGGGRAIRGMPRTSSVASSLNERFVSGEILEANMPAEGDAGEDSGEKQGGEVAGNVAKASKLS